jgi:LacI family transcriptional regulator
MSATIKEIASLARVSAVTVSRALNNKPDISVETKERILTIAKRVRYTPNGLAKSMITRTTKTIGLIMPNSKDPFYAEVIHGICKKLRDHGYSTVLCTSENDADQELALMRTLREQRVDGLLLYPLQRDERYVHELKHSSVPYVLLNRHSKALKCDYVMNDNVWGAFEAVNHLIEEGHKKIVYVCAWPKASSGKERIMGCKQAIHSKGLPPSALHIEYCDETIEDCYQLVKRLIAQGELHAIFAWDDRLAIGALKAIQEQGLRVPQDIALVGYDGIEISAHLFPPLTTVLQPSHQIGETAAQILLERLKHKDKSEPKHVVLKPRLVVRETTRVASSR